jgi:hypothetical protein
VARLGLRRRPPRGRQRSWRAMTGIGQPVERAIRYLVHATGGMKRASTRRRAIEGSSSSSGPRGWTGAVLGLRESRATGSRRRADT